MSRSSLNFSGRWREAVLQLELRHRRRASRVASNWPKSPSIRSSAGRWNYSTSNPANFATPRRKAIQINSPQSTQSTRRKRVSIVHLLSALCVSVVKNNEASIVFKALGNLANIGALMKQAQEMGGRMQALQEQLKTKRATGSAGGGLVEVEVNGLGEALAVRIDRVARRKGRARDDRRSAAGRDQCRASEGQAIARRGDAIARRRTADPGPIGRAHATGRRQPRRRESRSSTSCRILASNRQVIAQSRDRDVVQSQLPVEPRLSSHNRAIRVDFSLSAYRKLD